MEKEQRVIVCVVGARPNFMKIAPVISALRSVGISPYLVHTGQHYDVAMKSTFFDQLGIPEPDVDLEVGSGTHAVQTAEIMRRFEPVLEARRPAAVLVVGDVNSTIACALVAVKKRVAVIHVEAGLRSGDRRMPEEINRVLTDQISDLLFTTEQEAKGNLLREGIAGERVHFVGNVMIDTLLNNLTRAVAPAQTLEGVAGWEASRAEGKGFVLLTLHRPSNVDEKTVLEGLLRVVGEVAGRLPVVFPIHPRTRARIEEYGLGSLLEVPGLAVLGPLAYLSLLGLMAKARLVMTDSGGIQEETTALGIPCLTLRENTERPITVSEGTNRVVGSDPDNVRFAVQEVLETRSIGGRIPEFWDGKASERIASVIQQWLA